MLAVVAICATGVVTSTSGFTEASYLKSSNLIKYLYVYNAPESISDKRYEYQWEILRTALEKTKERYGSFSLQPSEPMTEKRQVYELENNTGRISVMYLDSTPELENKLLPIRIPVDKNLVGYRLLLIRKKDETKYAKIKTLNELTKISFGLALHGMM